MLSLQLCPNSKLVIRRPKHALVHCPDQDACNHCCEVAMFALCIDLVVLGLLYRLPSQWLPCYYTRARQADAIPLRGINSWRTLCIQHAYFTSVLRLQWGQPFLPEAY